jgi:hypothetical protein
LCHSLQVEKVMRALYVRRLRLWPRFQDDVQAAMDASPPEVRVCTRSNASHGCIDVMQACCSTIAYNVELHSLVSHMLHRMILVCNHVELFTLCVCPSHIPHKHTHCSQVEQRLPELSQPVLMIQAAIMEVGLRAQPWARAL